MTLPPRPCSIICRPAARQTSQEPATLASITDSQSSTDCSVDQARPCSCPAAATTMSMPPCGLDRGLDHRLGVVLGLRSPRRRARPSRRRRGAPRRPPRASPRCRRPASAVRPPPASACGGLLPKAPGRAGDEGRAPAESRRALRAIASSASAAGTASRRSSTRRRFVRFTIARASSARGSTSRSGPSVASPVVGDDRDLALDDDVDLLERRPSCSAPPPGRKCERPTQKFSASAASQPCSRSAVQSKWFGASYARHPRAAVTFISRPLPVSMRYSPVGSSIATSRTMQPSPFSQRQGRRRT